MIAFDNKGGIYVYDEVQDRFNPYADISELIEGDVLLSDVYPAEKGMWLAMREGVFFLQPDKVLTAVVSSAACCFQGDGRLSGGASLDVL